MIGSRYVPGGGVEGGFNLKRKFMSSGINWYARLMLGLKSKDNSGAFRCYRVSKLAEIDLAKVRSRGYSFQEEILFWCKQVGCRIGETPILFENRRSGISKINMREAACGPLDPLPAWPGADARRCEPDVRPPGSARPSRARRDQRIDGSCSRTVT